MTICFCVVQNIPNQVIYRELSQRHRKPHGNITYLKLLFESKLSITNETKLQGMKINFSFKSLHIKVKLHSIPGGGSNESWLCIQLIDFY